ncbi:MAG: DUF5610 domain-containing protein [Pseudomonadales bacterium]
MAISQISTSSISNPIDKASNKPEKSSQPSGEELSSAEIDQHLLNRAILESQQQLSLSAKNEPLSLILKAAIEGINEQLEPVFGENAIESAAENNLDVSPEATAARIVSQSTGFFAAFQQQNVDLGFEQQLEKFLDVIGGGIDKGFAEARNILDSLKVLAGDIAENIDRTYELVQSGLADFRDDQLSKDNVIV